MLEDFFKIMSKGTFEVNDEELRIQAVGTLLMCTLFALLFFIIFYFILKDSLSLVVT